MADSKITGLSELTIAPLATDWLAIVDVSDTTQSGSGSTKKISPNKFILSNGTANTLGNDLNVNSFDLNNIALLGIGTVPSTLLDIKGSVGSFQITSGGNQLNFTRASANYINCSSASGELMFITNGLSASYLNTAIYCNASSDVGIKGVSPSYALDVNGACHASSFPTSSDRRLKENLKPLRDTRDILDKLTRIKAYEFDWVDNYSGVNEFKRRDGIAKDKQIGFIAQEVELEFPELVTAWEHEGQDGSVISDAKAVDYTRMVPILLEAIKELSEEIDLLKIGARP